MLFTESRFLIFFLIVFGIHWSLRSNGARKSLLLVASYCFYGAWDWRFLFLIFASTAIDYVAGRKIENSATPRGKKRWLIVSLFANLGVLGFFKYFEFFVNSGIGILQLFGVEAEKQTLGIILPVGISFFTFQTMSYSIDVYRGRLGAVRNFLDFALFVSFFPQLVAGPIVRASTFLPQLGQPRRYSAIPFRAACSLFLYGFIKKACIADQVAGSVDLVFANPEQYVATAQAFGVALYAVQIYCDFSGYSEMAIACAMLLGFSLPDNFRHPYFATNITEFWRRWHISLSSWLRDYLYIPLGGNQGSRLFTHRNLLLTMLIGGLWHGAGWKFVIWGGIHGLALILHREITTRMSLRVPAVVGWIISCYIVLTAWIFFRAQNVESAAVLLRGFVLFQSDGTLSLQTWVPWTLLGLVVGHFLASREALSRIGRHVPDPVIAILWGIIAATALLFVPMDARPFIYFQF